MCHHHHVLSQWDPVQLAAPSDDIVWLQLSGHPQLVDIDDLTFCREGEPASPKLLSPTGPPHTGPRKASEK